MNILVLDVAAKETGAKTVLNEYFNRFNEDHNNNYFFCLSTIKLDNSSNVTVLNYPWVADNWFKRLIFEMFTIRKIVKDKKIEKIFSLQNIVCFFVKCDQDIYLQNCLPFTKHKFKLLRYPKLWFYQNIYKLIVKKSIKISKTVIVQTEWMKKEIVNRWKINETKILVENCLINVKVDNYFNINNWKNEFIYPATSEPYKNHICIFKAAKILVDKGIHNFKIYLTINESELSKNCAILYQNLRNQIVCCGRIEYNELIKMYGECILIFPSYIETVGLPLLEAKEFKDYIISADETFSREILSNYKNVSFFEYSDYSKLSDIIIDLIER